MRPSQASADRRPRQPARVRDALARLGIDRLVLSIHQASFPAGNDDLGRGTPYSARGRALLEWAARCGFTAVALGPAGLTARDNPSPYDASALSRDPLLLSPAALVDRGLVTAGELAAELAARPDGARVHHAHAWAAVRRLLAQAAARARADQALVAAVQARRTALPWLPREAHFEAIAAAVGHDDWRRWPDDPPQDAGAAWAFEVGQLLLDEQHAALAAECRRLGLRLYGDLAVGIAHRDRWWMHALFLPGYAMGAPPSRTNPDGQPWEFPVLDPGRGRAIGALLAERLDRVLDGCDGLRLDHPHGWVCPWVYRIDGEDRPAAVRAGARLHESPDLPDHPELARFARVRPDQIDRSRARHDDAWVADLEPAQVDAYAVHIDRLIDQLRARGGSAGDLMVEVLSTCPRPLAAVLERHRLGRFRVTQKARVADPDDVYRGDRAAPADWIMVGNHDTPPLRAVVAGWSEAEVDRRAAYLGNRLGRDPAELARDRDALATAMIAELFLGPARNVLIFWTDLFGLDEPYNRPGTQHPDNWTLRVPSDFEHAETIDLDLALTWALSGKGTEST